MPSYDYHCRTCQRVEERVVPIAERHAQNCTVCGDPMALVLTRAPIGKIAGQVTPGGGPDRFTADQLGIPLKELPPGLRTKT